jgi:peptide/nickel transport system ATP-binding protein
VTAVTSNGHGPAAAPQDAVKPPLLEVADLRTTFDTPAGLLRAVDGVSLRLEEGETYGIVGESGSGKTVLARSILNLVATRTSETTGSVKLRGRELLDLSPRDMRDVWGPQAAMIFQDPMTALNATMRVGDQVTESLRHHLDMGRKEATGTAVALLKSVGIPEPERRFRAYPHELSGGMRQRVTIAIALACGPKLLVADEPTTALDVTIQRQILDLLDTLRRDRAMGLILITHDLGVVAGRTDHIAVMYAGRVVERAPTSVLFARPRHPYTEGLLKSIPLLSQPSHTRLQVIPGRPPSLVDRPPGCAFAPRCRYAQPRCLVEVPELLIDEPGHEHACFFPVGSEAGAEALARNLEAGETAAGLAVTPDPTDVADAPAG